MNGFLWFSLALLAINLPQMLAQTASPIVSPPTDLVNCYLRATEPDCNAQADCQAYVNAIEHCGCTLQQSNMDVVMVLDFPETAGEWTNMLDVMRQAVNRVLGAPATNNRLAVFTTRNAARTGPELIFNFGQPIADFQNVNEVSNPWIDYLPSQTSFECTAIGSALTYMNIQGNASKRRHISIALFTNGETPCNVPTPDPNYHIFGIYDINIFLGSGGGNTPVIQNLLYQQGPAITVPNEPLVPYIDHYTVESTANIFGRSGAAFAEHWCEPIPASAPVTSRPTASPQAGPQSVSPVTASPLTSAPVTQSPSTSSPLASNPTQSPAVTAPSASPAIAPQTSQPSNSPITASPLASAPTQSPAVTAPSASPATAPQTTQPSNSPVTSSPLASSPTQSPAVTSPTASPAIAPQTTQPSQSPVTASPVVSAPTGSPATGSPVVTAPTQSPVGTGQAFGDPHYLTLDGLKYDFHGLCSYTLIEDIKTNDFEIISTNSACDLLACVSGLKVIFKVPIDSKIHYHDPIHYDMYHNISKILNIKHEDHHKEHDYKVVVRLELGPKIWVNDLILDLEKDAVYNYDGFHIISKYREASVKDGVPEGLLITLITDVGLRVQWDGVSFSSVSVHGRYQNKVAGLMGTLSYDVSDDLLLRNGSTVPIVDGDITHGTLVNDDKISLFAKSWLNKQPNDPEDCRAGTNLDIEKQVCASKVTQSRYKMACEHHLRGFKKYKQCIAPNMLDAAEWIDHCYHDMCSCRDEKTFFCMKFAGLNFLEGCYRAEIDAQGRVKSNIVSTKGFVHND